MSVTAPLREIGTKPEEQAYERYHAIRYRLLLELLRPHVRPGGRILDVGRSTLTVQLHKHFEVPTDSIGFEPDAPTATGRHYHFNLNDAQHQHRWRTDLPAYDVIVLAEVLEHLYTSPRLVLSFLRTLLTPGGVLVIQTPNALSLTKRVKPLLGRHPYELIREDDSNPGHFREYTANELRAYASAASFDVVHFGFYNYFDIRVTEHSQSGRPRWLESLKFHLLSLLPGPLKPGMTVILRRSS